MIPLITKPCSWTDKAGRILVLIKVKPNAKNTKIQGVVDVNTLYPTKKALLVAVAAQAEDNKANKELISFLSKELKIKKDKISLEHGEKNRLKVIALNI